MKEDQLAQLKQYVEESSATDLQKYTILAMIISLLED